MPFGTVLFALYPTLGIVLLLLTLVELAIRLVVMVVLAVLLGCELLVQWIVGAIRRRSPGEAGPGRRDPAMPENKHVDTLTVVTTRSEADVRRLTQELADHLKEHTPAQLSDDPAALGLITPPQRADHRDEDDPPLLPERASDLRRSPGPLGFARVLHRHLQLIAGMTHVFAGSRCSTASDGGAEAAAAGVR